MLIVSFFIFTAKNHYIAWACYRNVLGSGLLQTGLEKQNSSGGMETMQHLMQALFENLKIISQGGGGEHTGIVVRALDYGLGDPGSILGRVSVLFP